MTSVPWESLTLGDLGKWVTGSTPSSSDSANKGSDVLFVTPGDIGSGGKLGDVARRISNVGADRVRRIKPGSVILVCIGTIGKVAWTDREITTNQQINTLEVDQSRFDIKFVHWLLASPAIQEQLWQNSTSTTVALINKKTLEKIPCSVPPQDEQRRIAEALDDHLSRLDKALAEVEATMLKLETLERSTLESNFQGVQYSEQAESLPLSAVTDKVKSLDPKTLGVQEFKYVDIGSISADLESPRIMSSIATTSAPSRARQHLASGDVVFSTVRPYQKKIALIGDDLDGHIASTGFCVLRPKPQILDSRYLFHYLKSDMLLDQVLPLQRGASYPAVGDSDIKQATVPLPGIDIQRAIANTLDSVVGTIKVQKNQMQSIIEIAQTLRRSLLHLAFTGELMKEK
jgi:type I restriction enzyme S subunit